MGRGALDHRWIERWAAPVHARGLGWLVPVLAVCSLGATLLLPTPQLIHVAPWVCALTIALEAVYLARLSLAAAAAIRRHAGAEDSLARALPRALLQMGNLLIGMLVFAATLPLAVSHALQDSTTPGTARLLWFICVGGFMVAIAFGELLRLLLAATTTAR